MCSLEDLRQQIIDVEQSLGEKLDQYHADSLQRHEASQRRHNETRLELTQVKERVDAIEGNYLTREGLEEAVQTAVDGATDRIIRAIEDLTGRVTDNRTEIDRHSRQLNPWLRMLDGMQEVWASRSRIVKACVAIGAVSGAFIGIVGVVDILTSWVL